MICSLAGSSFTNVENHWIYRYIQHIASMNMGDYDLKVINISFRRVFNQHDSISWKFKQN